MRPKRIAEAAPAPSVFEFVQARGHVRSSSDLCHMTDVWRAGMQAFDFLGIGWLVCDSTGRLLAANPLAHRILSTADGLRLNSDGVPEATHGRKERLLEALQQATGTLSLEDESPRDRYMVLKRGLGQRAFTVVVHRVSADFQSEGAPAVALVLVLDPSAEAESVDMDLQLVYGFTAREAEIATMLMNGGSLRHCCERLGISRSTVCTHLRRMFKKTRVHRQSEMVAVLLKTVGLVGTRGDESHWRDVRRSNAVEPAVIRTLRRAESRPPILHVH